MDYIQHLKYDRLECETAETQAAIKDLCKKADELIDEMSGLRETEDSDDIQHNIKELNNIVAQLTAIMVEVEELEKTIPCFPEEYDIQGNR